LCATVHIGRISVGNGGMLFTRTARLCIQIHFLLQFNPAMVL